MADDRSGTLAAAVHELRHEVHITLTDAPALTDLAGRTRKPIGLRISYGLRRDIVRVDLVVDFKDEAQLWTPAAAMPDWLNRVVQEHTPRDVDGPKDARPTGMGGWPIDYAGRGGDRD